LRPQLKRDPLGGALPRHKHPFVTESLYGECAERRDARASRSSPRPAAPSLPRSGRAAQSFDPAAAQKQLPNESQPSPLFGAWRARALGECAPSNTRLKLAAPGSWGKLSFVTNQPRRRSLSAGR